MSRHTRTLTRLVAAATGAVAALSLGVAPAGAQRLVVDDPAGNAADGGLDIVRAALDNQDYAVRARVAFADLVRSDVIVSVDRRKGEGLRLVSRYRPDGTTRSFVLRGAFGDRVADDNVRLSCPGLRVTWNEDRRAVRFRMPSRCLNGDRYGALRFAVLTERGGDADYAPEAGGGDIGSSTWVPRG